jgi:hypothetical protein
MGYTTDFYGEFNLTPSLTEEQTNYINTFSETRRMKRDVNKLMELYKGKHGYPGRTGTPEEIYGNDGEFFVNDDGMSGQRSDESIIDYNTSPGKPTYKELVGVPSREQWDIEQKLINEGKCQPSLWCQWIVEENNTLTWDGGEKFYEYTAWLEYLITKFFQPWGIMVNGEIEWQGEERNDRGKIVVTDNVIQVLNGHVEYR